MNYGLSYIHLVNYNDEKCKFIFCNTCFIKIHMSQFYIVKYFLFLITRRRNHFFLKFKEWKSGRNWVNCKIRGVNWVSCKIRGQS